MKITWFLAEASVGFARFFRHKPHDAAGARSFAGRLGARIVALTFLTAVRADPFLKSVPATKPGAFFLDSGTVVF